VTKLLYCEPCGSILSPNRAARQPRWCTCARHAIWWENPSAGDIRLHDKFSVRDGTHVNGIPHRPAAYVLGLHNALLEDPSEVTTAAFVETVLRRTPSNYIFKEAMSLIIKFRPGVSDDSRWAAELP
jgi:hypothetical protein